MLDLKAETESMHGGMFMTMCKKCNVETENTFNRADRMVARFMAKCPKCGEEGEFRFSGQHWMGLQ